MLYFGDLKLVLADKRAHTSYLVRIGNEGGLLSTKFSKRKTCVLEQEIAIDNSLHSSREFIFIILDEKDNVLGACEIANISWINKIAHINICFFDLAETAPIYGSDILNMVLYFIFYNLGLNKVCADIASDDIVMSSIYLKHGFLTEVRKRNHNFTRGKYYPILEVSILAEEFKVI